MGLFDDLKSAVNNASGNRPNNNNKARDTMKKEYYHGDGSGTTSCRGCGKDISFSQAQADHITPRSKGGPDSSWNVQPLCGSCNRDKSDKIDGRTVEGYGNKIKDKFNK